MLKMRQSIIEINCITYTFKLFLIIGEFIIKLTIHNTIFFLYLNQ